MRSALDPEEAAYGGGIRASSPEGGGRPMQEVAEHRGRHPLD
jgi:hypothetical protein